MEIFQTIFQNDFDSFKKSFQNINIGDINNIQDSKGNTLLHLACKNPLNIEIVKEIINSGININQKNQKGFTPLYSTMINFKLNSNQEKFTEIIQELINNQANLETNDFLHLICSEQFPVQILQLFLEKKINPNKMDQNSNTPLQIAIKNNLYEHIELLLKFNAKIEKNDLFIACKNQSTFSHQIIELLLKENSKIIDVNLINPENQRTAIFYICESKSLNRNFALDVLHNFGANFNIKDSLGWTPLNLLFRSGITFKEFETIKKFEPNIKLSFESSKNKSSPLHFFCLFNAIENKNKQKNASQLSQVIDWLIQEGNSVDHQNSFLETPLHYCCIRKNSSDLINLLIERKADPKIADINGQIPLHILCKQSQPILEHIKLFVESGSDVNLPDSYGNTPLHYSCQNCAFSQVLQMLISLGANPLIENNKKQTPIHFLVSNPKTNSETQNFFFKASKKIFKRNVYLENFVHLIVENEKVEFAKKLFIFLAQKKKKENLLIDVDEIDSKGRTPLMIACEKANGELADLLIQFGANVNAEDMKGNSVLIFALKKRAPIDLIHVLVKSGANTCTGNYKNDTPLHIASRQQNNFRILKLLIGFGGNKIINSRNWKKNTPLMEALSSNNIDYQTIKFLINSGANVNVVNILHETPLHIACLNPSTNKKVVNMLIEYGCKPEQENIYNVSSIFNALCFCSPTVVNLLVLQAGNPGKLTIESFQNKLKNQEIIQKYHLKTKNRERYHLQIVRRLLSLLFNSFFADFELVDSQNKKFFVHKNLLIARLGDDQERFNLLCSECKNLSYQEVRKLLFWVYAGIIVEDFAEKLKEILLNIGIENIEEKSNKNGLILTLRMLYKDEKSKNITFLFDDSQKISAHKEILLVSSDFFRDLIENSTYDSNQHLINISLPKKFSFDLIEEKIKKIYFVDEKSLLLSEKEKEKETEKEKVDQFVQNEDEIINFLTNQIKIENPIKIKMENQNQNENENEKFYSQKRSSHKRKNSNKETFIQTSDSILLFK
ncbi:ankyrin repeat-containing protein [Anaeramoeba ignava]|uniref:Ankyrin repeat-containing protein n=1 Tax=Anaeramoeba ignava TaxID=1746090 RepID=A0A9Q0RDL9_ANAIG|nr:ankyrin repeat-containing protein [Anaeramoeba ignava]